METEADTDSPGCDGSREGGKDASTVILKVMEYWAMVEAMYQFIQSCSKFYRVAHLFPHPNMKVYQAETQMKHLRLHILQQVRAGLN